jgi:predicted acyl esterase
MPQGERSMTVHDRVRAAMAQIALPGLVLCVATCLAQAPPQAPPQAQYPALQSETPAKFQAVTDSFDYVRREIMIPMRDGVKLHTVILVPKGATHAPILLTRTPYDANRLTSHAQSSHLAPTSNARSTPTARAILKLCP